MVRLKKLKVLVIKKRKLKVVITKETHIVRIRRACGSQATFLRAVKYKLHDMIEFTLTTSRQHDRGSL